MASSHPTQSSTTSGGLPLLLASLSAIGPFSIDAYLPSMGEIQTVMHTSPYALQMTLTAYMGPFALMTLWHGAISDAVGRRRVVLWGMALFALASIACACAQNIAMLLVFRALQGATAGAGMVVGRAIVRDRFHGPDAQRVMSQVSMTFALAPAIAPVIGGWLQSAFGWRSVFFFLVLYSGVIWLICRRILPETLPREKRQTLHPIYLLKAYWTVLSSPRFLAVCLGSTFCFAGLFLYVAAAPEFLMHQLGIASTGFFWLFGPLTVGMALGAWLSGRFAGRISPTRTLSWGVGCMGAAAAGNLWFHRVHPPVLPWSLTPIMLYSFGMALAFPTLTLLALDLFPEQRGLAASCQSFISTGGAALVAVFAPLVWATSLSLATSQLAAVAIALVFVAVYWRFARDVPHAS
jgi:DHA1 family bicyclomycin/chloramphenicol resistance-like MFS transporter